MCFVSATIFAYGQTNSGKTYTMTGITEYSVADIYDHIKRVSSDRYLLVKDELLYIFCMFIS